MPNAIDTLSTAIGEWAGHDETDPAFAPEWAALTDVGALLQAAQDVGDVLKDPERWNLPQALEVLAAAVRNVTGET